MTDQRSTRRGFIGAFVITTSTLVAGRRSFAATGRSSTPGLAVIAHRDVPVDAVSVDDLLFMCIRHRQDWRWVTGPPVRFFNLPAHSPERTLFDRAVLDKTPDEVTKMWIDIDIRAERRRPRELPSVAAVAHAVAQTPGALSYCPLEAIPPDVKVLASVGGDHVITTISSRLVLPSLITV